jgi:hypothetical protein
MRHNALSAIAELERRYNGPVPAESLSIARMGSAEAVELLFAEGQAAFYKRMVIAQLAVIRQRRRDHSSYAALFTDLDLYRRCWRRWHRESRALRTIDADGIHPPSFFAMIAPTTKDQGGQR